MPRSLKIDWDKVCRVQECDKKVIAQGLCQKHYYQARKGKELPLRGSETPTRVPWVWSGDEQSLIDADEAKTAADATS
jgi:hypothetical protein